MCMEFVNCLDDYGKCLELNRMVSVIEWFNGKLNEC